MTSPALTIASPATRNRLGGLDGLRAIAVGLVLTYHLFPQALPGGFLGVDIFFVISGFLITTLLISEHESTGRLALASFWRRRARRLLPALALVLLVCTSAAVLAGKELLVNIAAQLAGASFFVANWVYIALGTDYFAQDNAELFRNTWSLAIEEQFYVLLPLVLIFALRMRSRGTRVMFFTLLGLISALLMGALALQGIPSTRVYFGTDTHVFGLLFGVALACALKTPTFAAPASEFGSVSNLQPTQRRLSTAQQLALLLAGVLALGVVGWLAATLREGSQESFLGGFQMATASALLLVWAATRPGAWLGRALDIAPLRWIGERSYGIYLWHWPLLLIVAAFAEQAGAENWWLVPGMTLALTLLFAALSFRFIEQPVRRIGLLRSLSRLVRPARMRGRQLAIGWATILVILLTVPTTGYAISIAPTQHGAAQVVSRGEATLESQQTGIITKPKAGDEATAPAQDSLMPQGLGQDWANQPLFNPKITPIEGWEMFALGDSVMLASAPELADAFPEIWIDAAVSRGMSAGVEIANDLSARGELRQVLVVGLGTNGPIDDADLNELLRIADGRQMVLVNAYADRWWVPEVNQQLAAFAEQHRGVTLADWAGTIPQVPDGLAGDDIHPNPSGGIAYAEVVQSALDELQTLKEQPKPAVVKPSGSGKNDSSSKTTGSGKTDGSGKPNQTNK